MKYHNISETGDGLTNKNIFDVNTSADYFTTYESGYSTRELIYAVTSFDETGNIEFTGAKKLVTIPMRVVGKGQISIGKIVIVRKDGTVVRQVPFNVTNTNPIQVGESVLSDPKA